MTIRMMLVAAAAAALVACGGGDDDAAATAPAQPTPPTAPTQPETPPPASTRSDVSVAVALAPDPAVSGGTATYTVRIANAGPDAASNVPVQLTFDAEQQLKAVTCAATGNAQCPSMLGESMTLSTLPTGGGVTFSIAATVPASATGTVGLTATAQAANDAATSNNSVQSSTQVIAPNTITLQSDSGDYIGQGRAYSYTKSNAAIKLTPTGNRVDVYVDGDENWSATFQLPSGKARLEPGTYAGLTRYPFHEVVTGGLSWSGEGRGCNNLTGSFTIDNVVYSGDTLKVVALHFEQHCEGGAAALKGTLHWSSYDQASASGSGPVTPVPASLWQPAAGSVPPTGNYVYLASDAGDYIGGGSTVVYTPATTASTLQANGATLLVSLAGWRGTFQGGQTLTRIEPGYYADLQRWPFHNPVKGGLDWSGNGRGCNTLQGWFAVDSVTYNGTALTAIDLRFEQHCEGQVPALRGKIHWVL